MEAPLPAEELPPGPAAQPQRGPGGAEALPEVPGGERAGAEGAQGRRPQLVPGSVREIRAMQQRWERRREPATQPAAFRVSIRKRTASPQHGAAERRRPRRAEAVL